MSKHLFYEPTMPTAAGTAEFSDASFKHAVQVLRLKTGSTVHITNGLGFWANATVNQVEKKYATYSIQQVHQAHFPLQTKLILAVAPTKNLARFEWMLEKVVEMGVQTVIPLLTKRTEKFFVKPQRLEQIAISAMLQSQQYFLPNIAAPTTLEDCIKSYAATQKLIAHCEAGERQPLRNLKIENGVLLLIGPEGDFTPEEIQWASSNGFMGISLGATKLRTETAALVASALVLVE